MLLAVVAMTTTYSLAQNANSGVTVSKNGDEIGLVDECGYNYIASNSNFVLMANGFIKWTGTFDVSAAAACSALPSKTERQNFIEPGLGEVTIIVTPSGQATLKINYNPNNP